MSFKFKTKKSLSQHFLVDESIIEKMCQVASIQTGDRVLEIGPGKGAITESLLKKGASVIAVEKDEALADRLQKNGNSSLKVFCGDTLEIPLDSLIEKGTKIVANLPFNITTPFIERFITTFPKIATMTLIVQKEVGIKMTALKNTQEYCYLSLFVKAFSNPAYLYTINPKAFSPPPKVECSLVHLELQPSPLSSSFFAFTRKAFHHKRKMVRSIFKETYSSKTIETSLRTLGLLATTRPQELDLGDLTTLFKILESKKDAN